VAVQSLNEGNRADASRHSSRIVLSLEAFFLRCRTRCSHFSASLIRCLVLSAVGSNYVGNPRTHASPAHRTSRVLEFRSQMWVQVQKVQSIFVLICVWQVAFLPWQVKAQTNSVSEKLPVLADSGKTEPIYIIGKFILEYGPQGSKPHPGLPSLTNLIETKIQLGRTNDLFTGATEKLPISTFSLTELPKPIYISAAGIKAIEATLVKKLNQLGLYGVWATPSTQDIHPRTGEDLREGRTDLTLIIYVPEIVQLRTIAKGTRIPRKDAINNEVHSRIAANSPLQPAQDGSRGSLFTKAQLDDYIGRLNRFPGRSVDAAISASSTPGAVVLDYLISEGKPWVAYAQVSNTGTSASDNWMERFGFIDQQLTSHDDILTLDYSTSDFQTSHAFFGSYDIPLIFPDILKFKAYGSYTEYSASDLGISGESLSGNSGEGGADLTCTPLTFSGIDFHGLSFATFYVDLTLGARWEGIEVNNQTFGSDASTDLVIPYVGLSVSSVSQKTKLAGGVQLEGNLSGLAGTEKSELPDLGRLDTDANWVLAKWGTGFSFFLEPLISPQSTLLANEISISSQGQYTFDDHRLIPQQEQLIGGFNSVRGYPEALDAGDTVFVGTAEYRFYLARVLSGNTEENLSVGSKTSQHDQFGNPFRFRAKDAYGRPNWDFILRTFVDGGQSYNNRSLPSETDRSLLSTGVGAELEIRRNLDIRLDYGIALLSETQNLTDPVNAGDGRVIFSVTVAW